MTQSSSKFDVTSHSRLGVYETCSKKFEYEYIHGMRTRSEADHFLIGTACHRSIEEYYLDATGWLQHPTNYLDTHWNDWLEGLGLEGLLPTLRSYRQDVAKLWERASADYVGKDAIRKRGPFKGAEIWKNPVADNPTMTGDWKNAMENLGLAERAEEIDRDLQLRDPVFINVSLSNAYSQSWEILKGYKDPDTLASVEYIEFPISDSQFDETGRRKSVVNPVKLPRTGTYFNGYIDLVAKAIPQLGGGVVLIDHKSSSGSAPSVVEVAHHSQLLKYSWAWHQITGEWPTHIGINHLRTGKCVIAPVDKDLAQSVIERMEDLILAQKAGIFIKKDPFAYNSPCMRFKDGKLYEFCPHLLKCHPTTAKNMGLIPEELKSGFQ